MRNSKKIRIATAGSHGTGKTFLAKKLARRLGINYIHDIVREEAVPKGFEINENTPLEVQLWLVMRQWELERITPPGWVADKCLFDYLIYGEIALKDAKAKKIIRDVVLKNAKYDYVVWIPIEFPMEKDGVRSEEEDFRKEVERRYKSLLKKLGIKLILVSGSKKARVEQAVRHINQNKK